MINRKNSKQSVALLCSVAIFWSFFAPLFSLAGADVAATGQPQNSPATADGLIFRLSNASGNKTGPERQPAAAEPLTPVEAERLLSRLAPISPDLPPSSDFPSGADSPKPPKARDIIGTRFPPDENQPAPAVNAPPTLSVLRFAPDGEVSETGTISVTFSDDMVPVGSQEAAAAFVPVSIEPAVKGKWRWLGTRTLLFEAAERLPMATRFTARIPAGTSSKNGATLEKDVVWHFSTSPPKVVAFFPNNGRFRRETLIVIGFDQKIDANEILKFISIEAAGAKIAFRPATEAEIAADSGAAQFIKSIRPDRRVIIRPIGATLSAAESRGGLPPDSNVVVSVRKGAPSAEGPLAATADQVFTFTTYGAMRFEAARCGWSEQSACAPSEPIRLTFSTPIETSKFDPKMISIEPVIEDARIYPAGSEIIIEGRKKPQTEYRLKIDAALSDVIGQTLGKSATATIRTLANPPALFSGTDKMVVANPFKKPTYSVVSNGFDALRVKVYRVEPEDWLRFLRFAEVKPADRAKTTAITPGKLVSDSVVSVGNGSGDYVETIIDLSGYLNTRFGHLVLEIQPAEPAKPDERRRIAVWVQVTGIGLDAFVDDKNIRGFVTDLASGRPVAGAEVSLIAGGADSDTLSSSAKLSGGEVVSSSAIFGELLAWSRPEPNPLTEGTENVLFALANKSGAVTGSDGLATLRLPAADTKNPPQMLVARRGADRAFLPAADSVYEIQSRYDEWVSAKSPDSLRWFLFNDRGIYRPGESVSVKGYLRRVQPGTAAIISGVGSGTIEWTLRDSRNNEIAKGNAAINAFGGFNLEAALPEKGNLGQWRLEFQAKGVDSGIANVTSQHWFEVQEFRRPDFEVKAKVESPGPHLVGGNAVLSASATYYSGGALAGSAAKWSIGAVPTSYTPPNRDDFSFGRWVPWWRGIDSRDRIGDRFGGGEVQTFDGTTDAEGRHLLQIDFDSVAPPQPYLIEASVTVSDVNRQAIASETSFIVHPSTVYVGLRTPRSYVSKSAEIPVEAIATDIDGNLLSGRQIGIIAVAKDWRFEKGEWRQIEIDRQSCNLTSGNEPARCSIIAKVAGNYAITARVLDDLERPNESEIGVWVMGGKMPPTEQLEAGKAQLIPAKKEFSPGEMAEILVISPFASADGVLTLRRGGTVVSATHFKVADSAATLKFPVSEDLIPNIIANVTLSGAAEAAGGESKDVADSRPAFAIGTTSIPVSAASRRLSVAAEARDKTLSPGASTKINIDVRGADGQPVADSEVAVVIVDESVLALTGYRIPDPVAAMYEENGDSTREYNLRRRVIIPRAAEYDPAVTAVVELSASKMTAMPPPAGAISYEGRGAAGKEIVVRKDFRPLALFSPTVRTDSEGRATLDVKLPDNLTRYRITAVATDGKSRFGKGESTLTVRQPLMLRPSAPRFLNIGDVAELPAVIENQTDRDLAVAVAIRGVNIAIGTNSNETGSPMGKKLVVKANSREEVRFPVAAKTVGTARFQLAAAAENYSDAAEIAVPILAPATSEAFATYGSVEKSGAIARPFQVPAGIYQQFGGLEISLSSTQLQELTDAFVQLANYPFECTEQISSRMLSVAALRDVLTAFGTETLPSRTELDARFAKDIEILRSRQRSDGSFGLWRRDPERFEYPLVSIHAAHALAVAKAKGYAVPDEMLAASVRYLKSIESRLSPEINRNPQVKTAIIAYALNVRSAMGDRDIAKARQLLPAAMSGKASFEAIGWLLSVIAGDPASKPQVDEVLRFLGNRVAETASSAHFVTDYGDEGWLIMQSDRRADGVLLDALLKADPNSDLIPKLVRGLLDSRVRGAWSGTQENVFILLALDSYFRSYEAITPEFVARVWVGAGYGGENAFNGRSGETKVLKVPTSYLLGQGSQGNIIIDKDGPGRLYYRIGFDYAPLNLMPAPANYGFSVSRIYSAVDDPNDVRRNPDGSWQIRPGARVRVRVTVMAPARRNHVALVDRLPAGFEILNPSLATTGKIPPRNWNEINESGARNFWPDHQNFRDDRAEAFTAWLSGGIYEYSYVVRSTTPGRYIAPPAKAEEMYHPETFGRSGAEVVIIQ